MIVIDKYNKLVNKAKKKRSRITETEKRLMVTSSCGGGGGGWRRGHIGIGDYTIKKKSYYGII